MCQQKIPFGETMYPKWRQEMDTKMKNGKEIWFLGIKWPIFYQKLPEIIRIEVMITAILTRELKFFTL